MDVSFHEEVSYFMKPSSDSPLQDRGGMKCIFEEMSAIDGNPSTVIPETISTDDSSDVPNELPVAGMSNELPFQLPAASMTNKIHVDGSSNDDSSNGLVQDCDTYEVNSDDSSTYQLPPRVNHGKPKVQYEPDIHVKAKYPINNYVSTHRLSKPYASYICQLSSVSIPTKLQDALSDPKWVNAMTVKMEALEKNSTWNLVPLPNEKKTVGCR
ncbi:uncharacterized protein [Malus domestica]|uniref:uncharacterized protein n=1 Tax=Malus domestica TaxID=3750 RepID=UPI003976B3F0